MNACPNVDNGIRESRQWDRLDRTTPRQNVFSQSSITGLRESRLARFISDCPHLTRTLRGVPLKEEIENDRFSYVSYTGLH